jgi:hypothetical protein
MAGRTVIEQPFATTSNQGHRSILHERSIY